MVGKFDIVDQETAKNSFLIIGIQFGLLGYVIRLGLYKQNCTDNPQTPYAR